MKRTIIFLFFSYFLMMEGNAQSFSGTYTGTMNGDHVVLTLESVGANKYAGNMNDSQQKYIVEATSSGNNITGTAKENTLGITFQLKGQLKENQLFMNYSISFLGQTNSSDVVFSKQGSTNSKPQGNKKIPSGAERDARLVGKWQQSETYTSGYGDNFFSGTSTNNLIFLEDGTLADGGSQTTMSGSNYYGNSGQSEIKRIPNVSWFTKNSHIFLIASENGQTQTVDLGKYYIENGNMLITGNNGKKVLFSKK